MPINANASGVVTGKFTIPAGVPAGSKLVEFEGGGGSSGRAAFIGSGTEVANVRQTVTTLVQTFYDPLAQTFTVPEACQIAAIDLWFAAVGTSPVVVQIRETSTGLPNATVLAETRLAPSAINTASHTRATFGAPVALQPNIEYAIVALCDDAVSALRMAELGKYDSTNVTWVTGQPYQIGVLLSSSNASTWTPHQDRDLTFRLHKAVFTQTNKTVALGNVAVVGATDLILLANEETPSSDTYIEYDLAIPGGQTITVASGQQVRLAAAVTGNIAVSARMYGSASASPILFPGTQLVVGIVGATGTYVSRAIKGGAGVRVKVIFDALIPGGASVGVQYKGIDPADVWATVPFVGSTVGDEGFYEITHEVTPVTEDMIQIRLNLAGTTAARPRVRNLRFMTI
jgi:hypothetical protein